MKTQIKHFDLYGKRNHKYDFLLNNNIKSINWNELNPNKPYYFFVEKDFSLIKKYEEGIKLTVLFAKYSAGIKTKVDHIAIDFNKYILMNRVRNIIENKMDFIEIKEKYGLSEKTTWEYKPNYDLTFSDNKIIRYEYRPFDFRFTYFDSKFLSRSRDKIMKNFIKTENIGIETSRNGDFIFIGKNISDEHFVSDNSFKFPLYLYPDQGEQGEIIEQHRTPNLNPEIVKQIEKVLGLKFTSEKSPSSLSEVEVNKNPSSLSEAEVNKATPPSTTLRELNSSSLSENNPSSLSEVEVNTFAPIDLLDYIYAVLHSPAYREKYKEFLKIDFPRVPYPKAETFWKLVEIGKQIREIHLLESPKVENYITKYPINGSNIVEKVSYKESKVYINSEQYFDGVPEVAWNFYIGGYQPAQKWLKDRKGRELNFDDIMHYQKIIVALSETDKLMKEIDKVGV